MQLAFLKCRAMVVISMLSKDLIYLGRIIDKRVRAGTLYLFCLLAAQNLVSINVYWSMWSW